MPLSTEYQGSRSRKVGHLLNFLLITVKITNVTKVFPDKFYHYDAMEITFKNTEGTSI